ncbi:hypothetical protein GCM10023165_25220 [Variovorax defluvii]|uniref:Secreted protein n=1 Tax=Variovorax defluvii TaxID=913761 RepID=A0ABP8HR91_9BURK
MKWLATATATAVPASQVNASGSSTRRSIRPVSEGVFGLDGGTLRPTPGLSLPVDGLSALTHSAGSSR